MEPQISLAEVGLRMGSEMKLGMGEGIGMGIGMGLDLGIGLHGWSWGV